MNEDVVIDYLAHGILWGSLLVSCCAPLVVYYFRSLRRMRTSALERARGVSPEGLFAEREVMVPLGGGLSQVADAAAIALRWAGLRDVGRGEGWCAGGAPFASVPYFCLYRWWQVDELNAKITVVAEWAGHSAIPMRQMEHIIRDRILERSKHMLGLILESASVRDDGSMERSNPSGRVRTVVAIAAVSLALALIATVGYPVLVSQGVLIGPSLLVTSCLTAVAVAASVLLWCARR